MESDQGTSSGFAPMKMADDIRKRFVSGFKNISNNRRKKDKSYNQRDSNQTENALDEEEEETTFDACVCPCVSIMLMMVIVIVVIDVVVFVGVNNIHRDVKDSEEFPGDKRDAFLIEQELQYLQKMVQLMIPKGYHKAKENRMSDDLARMNDDDDDGGHDGGDDGGDDDMETDDGLAMMKEIKEMLTKYFSEDSEFNYKKVLTGMKKDLSASVANLNKVAEMAEDLKVPMKKIKQVQKQIMWAYKAK